MDLKVNVNLRIYKQAHLAARDRVWANPHTLKSSNPQIRGFTMIELLVVISLIIILATMGMSQYKTGVVRANEAVLNEDLFRMRDAIDQYYADKGNYPAAL